MSETHPDKPTITRREAKWKELVAGIRATKAAKEAGGGNAPALDALVDAAGGICIGEHRLAYSGLTVVLIELLHRRYKEAGRGDDIGTGHVVFLLAEPWEALRLLQQPCDLEGYEASQLALMATLRGEEINRATAWFAAEKARIAGPAAQVDFEGNAAASRPESAEAGQAGW